MRHVIRRILDCIRESLQAVAHGRRARGVVDGAADPAARGADYAANCAGDASDCRAELERGQYGVL